MTGRAKKDCFNCHWGHQAGLESRCFDGVNCFANSQHPNWTPETNGDRVRKMTDEQLRDLWGNTIFEKHLIPKGVPCSGDEVHYCKWPNFSCECCPETFFNWLQAVAEERD